MHGLPSLLRSAVLAGLVAIASFVPLTVETPVGSVAVPVQNADAFILTGPHDAVTVRVNFSDVDDALDNLGLNPTQHLVDSMNMRFISVNQLINALQRGARYHDTATGATVYYLGRLAVIVQGHTVVNAFRGQVKGRWVRL